MIAFVLVVSHFPVQTVFFTVVAFWGHKNAIHWAMKLFV